MINLNFNKKPEDGEFSYHRLNQLGLIAYAKNKSTRDKTAIHCIERNTCPLVQKDERKSILENKDEVWGINGTNEDYVTYDQDIYNWEEE